MGARARKAGPALLGAWLLAALPCSPVAANCSLLPGNPESAPDNRFTLNGDGTLNDQRTGLMWSVGLQGGAVAHPAAQALADASTLAGHGDWRLPTRKELLAIVESGCARPALNTSRFTAGSISVVWSSSAGPGPNFWFVDFTYGGDGIEHRDTPKGVRLVRSIAGTLFRDGFE